jgi:hypothetical protein
VHRAAIFRAAIRYGFSRTVPEPKQALNRRRTEDGRRRTDGDGQDALRAAHRIIAERAYQLYVEGGCDRDRLLEYWRLAERDCLASRLH